MQTVVSRLHDHATDRPEATAVAIRDTSGWKKTSWGQLDAEVRATSRALIALGVEPGGTVGILGFNRPEWMITCVGSMAAGAVPAGIYQTCSADQVAYILRHAESRVVVVENREQLEKVEAARGELDDLLYVVVMSSAGLGEVGSHVLPWAEFLKNAEEVPESEAEAREAEIRGEQTATLIYTSGTTGTPKAVVQTHRSFANTTELYAVRALGYAPDDVTISVPKLFFGYATGSNLFFPFAVGASAVLFEDKPTPEALFERVAKHRATILINVPTMIQRMLGHAEENAVEVASLRFATSAGEALPVPLYHRWKERFGVELLDGLGTAEMWHIFVTNRPGDVHPGTLGKVVEGFELKVCDAEGQEVGPDEVG